MSDAQQGYRTTDKRRVFVTGSAEGLGYAMAQALLVQGHEVVIHVRSRKRIPAVQKLLDKGAIATIGDLSDYSQIFDLARQVNAIGHMDAVVHNAGLLNGRQLLMVNVVAPYLLTGLIQRPGRLIYLSSSMHRGGHACLTGMDWNCHTSTGSYSDSKLFITTLSAAVARLWPDVYSNAVDPGWVPTRMGGPSAPDNLRLGHLTQEWLATSDDAETMISGGYWHHQRREHPHSAVNDIRFQNLLLNELERVTGTELS
ncbi:SDR family NAD(P)-dependent oxidoreductase [Enterobacter sp.]|uniref:SDR family NAD(P)-dependent oxidoreductase n=1 Tax=Enterobacter sp. TaxID=42895 RepID=UPI002905306D|nr:SDR family NAD(P)-dependent oxidoreductase [Enterobacter sp.]MDU1920099.1 SDR family NAD(P)-dependent oxidoreductase [Enterobacter sp.]MDU2002040.1 SDR family NAD(P)-dependent oxidoreductase [Enterobacter hormaechei]MDU2013728.1 SDR family NAD(P)-dependent oxidoreductase [Enterobacter hormaechei]